MFVLGVLLLSMGLVSAIDLDVSAKPIQNSAIMDLDEPAVFELTIRNLGESDEFEIYSLIGIDISPESAFAIGAGETRKIQIKAMPQGPISSKKGFLTFEYKIKNSQSELQAERLTINIIELGDALSVTSENINPESEKVVVEVKNKISYDFEDLKIKINSVFFDFEESFSLDGLETKEFEIELDNEKLKTLVAGPYLLNSLVEVKDVSTNIESMINFLQQEGIKSSEISEGFFIKRTEIIKTNVGNVVEAVEINAQKNIFSYLFTTFNIVPGEVERDGFRMNYVWRKEIVPNEELKVIIKTNWFYPIIIVLFIIVLFWLIRKSVETNLILRKKVSFVKTRGGEFALRISLIAKAKKFIERICVVDKLPPLVNLYERYGAIAPDKVDLKNRRMEWNIESLNKGEERIFSYIIYSKIGIVGRFELPIATATCDIDGMKEVIASNRAFFVAETSAAVY